MIGKILILSLLCFHQSLSLKLPSYFKPCATSDPNFNECAKKHGQLAIPGLLKGDRKYKIPNLSPLVIPELNINQGQNLKIMLKNVTLYGLEKAVIQDANFDFQKKHVTLTSIIPVLTMDSNYEIAGRILILPISGKGPARLVLNNLKFSYNFDFDVYEKGGVSYMRPHKGKVPFEIDGLKINFENLFNGDKLLGPSTNEFLNENWRELSKELGPAVAEALAQVVNLILVGVTELVPYKELFPDKI